MRFLSLLDSCGQRLFVPPTPPIDYSGTRRKADAVSFDRVGTSKTEGA